MTSQKVRRVSPFGRRGCYPGALVNAGVLRSVGQPRSRRRVARRRTALARPLLLLRVALEEPCRDEWGDKGDKGHGDGDHWIQLESACRAMSDDLPVR